MGRQWNRRRWATGLLVLLAAVLAWPLYAPALAGVLLRRTLGRAGFPGATARVLRITPWTLELEGLRLGADPDAPACRHVTVTFSPAGLRRGRVDGVSADGMRILLRRNAQGELLPAGVTVPAKPNATAAATAAGAPLAVPVREVTIQNAMFRVETAPGEFREWTLAASATAEKERPEQFRITARALQGGRGAEVQGTVVLPVKPDAMLAVEGEIRPVLRPGDLPAGVHPAGPLPTLTFRVETQLPSVTAAGRFEINAPRLAVDVQPPAAGPLLLAGRVAISGSWKNGDVAGELRLGAAEAVCPAAELILRDLEFRQPFTASGATGWQLAAGTGKWQTCSWRGLNFACSELRSEPAADGGAALVLRVQPEGSAAAPAARLAFHRGAPGPADWRANVTAELPDTAFAEDDPFLKMLLRDAGGWRVSGTAGGIATGEWQPGRAPVTGGTVRLGDVRVRNTDDTLAVDGLQAAATFSSLLPLRSMPAQEVRFREVRLEKPVQVRLGPGVLAGQAELPDRFFLERGEVGWGGGKLRTYALHINRLRPEGEALLYAENLDVGGLLGLFRGFKGKGSGRLYGRIPLRFAPGSIRLEDAYLYAPPGQGGTLELSQTGWLKDTLTAAGTAAGTVGSVQKALADFKFNVFRVDLESAENGEAVLRLRLTGRARQDPDLPPVDLNVNVHAPFQTLFDLGLKLAPALGQ